MAHRHRCASPPPPISWFAWLNVRRHAVKLGWWVALLFTLGSILFVVSGAATLVRPVEEPSAQPPGLRSANAGLIAWPNAVAANLCFFPGGILQVSRSLACPWWRADGMPLRAGLVLLCQGSSVAGFGLVML